MKRQYITPSVFCVKLEIRSSLMQNMSINDKEIELDDDNKDDFGLAREDNNNTDNDNNNRNSVWENIW